MKKIIVQTYLFCLFSLFFMNYSIGQNQNCNNYSDTTLVIKFDASATHSDIINSLAPYGGTVLDFIGDYNLNIYLVEFDLVNNPYNFTSIEDIHGFFDCNGGINNQTNSVTKPSAVDFDYKLETSFTTSGKGNYNLKHYNLSPNCSEGFLGRIPRAPFKINIAVIDSGHKDNTSFDHLISNEGAYDFVDNDHSPNDISFSLHGTNVNSVIAPYIAQSQNIKIVPIKILDEQGETSWFTFCKGLVHAININADVINLSVGALFCSDDLCTNIFEPILEIADAKRILVSAAAGNNGLNIDDNYYISTSHQLIRYFMSAFFRYIPFKNKSVAELCTYF